MPPFGVLLGVANSHSRESWTAWAGTDLIFGGSAHLTLIEMLRTGSGLLTAGGVALLINARLLVYSSSLIPLWGSARLTARLLAAAAVIDPTWMIATRRAQQRGTLAQQRAHYAGAAIVLTVGWTAAVTAGVFLGAAPAVTSLLEVSGHHRSHSLCPADDVAAADCCRDFRRRRSGVVDGGFHGAPCSGIVLPVVFPGRQNAVALLPNVGKVCGRRRSYRS